VIYEGIRFEPEAQRAVAHLGDEIRRVGADGWCSSMLSGAPIDREAISAHLPAGAVDALLESRLAVADGADIILATTIASVGGVLTAIPNLNWGPDAMYVGPDALFLIEAVLRLAPQGARAADLATGTGLLAAALAPRYRVVVATDIHRSVALAAAITMALNHAPSEHVSCVCVADVAGGLRRDSFDLVAANPPWVPVAVGADRPRELYSYGGETGIELPQRFLLEGAALLRAGGVGITLALDMELDDGRRPLREVRDHLDAAGYRTELVRTPWSIQRQQFVNVIRERQPLVVDAEHVAVVVARPHERDDEREELVTAVEALRARWAS
jgi:hypothetical protein